MRIVAPGFLLLCMLAVARPALATQSLDVEDSGRTLLVFSGGASYWGKLHRLDFAATPEPDVYGQFQSVGLYFGMAAHFRLLHFPKGDLYVGTSLGGAFHGTEGDSLRILVPPPSPDLPPSSVGVAIHINTFLLSPGARWFFGGSEASRLFAQGGVGYYRVGVTGDDSFMEVHTTLESADSFGFHAGVGWMSAPVAREDVGDLRLFVETEAHFPRLSGTLFDSPEGALNGPLVAFRFGVGF